VTISVLYIISFSVCTEVNWRQMTYMYVKTSRSDYHVDNPRKHKFSARF